MNSVFRFAAKELISYFQKNRIVISCMLIGLGFSVAMFLFSNVCDRAFQIPDGGGYASEAVFLCLIPHTPAIMSLYVFGIFSDSYPPTNIVLNIFFGILFLFFYPILGALIGLEIQKWKRRKTST